MRVSHIMVAVWALVMSSVACLWNGIGLSLNWLFLFTGVCIAGAVIPVIFTVMWRKQSAVAAMSGAIGGAAIGIICWLVVTVQYIGPISITTTGLSPLVFYTRKPES
jgi:urea-proton symporter